MNRKKITGAEILHVCWTISSFVEFVKTSKVFVRRMLRKGADLLGVKKALIKMINRQILHSEKMYYEQMLMLFLFNVSMYLRVSITNM